MLVFGTPRIQTSDSNLWARDLRTIDILHTPSSFSRTAGCLQNLNSVKANLLPTADDNLRNGSQGEVRKLSFADEVKQENAYKLHCVEGIPIREEHHFGKGLRWQRRAWTVAGLNSAVIS